MVAAVSAVEQGGARYDLLWETLTTAGNASIQGAPLRVSGAFGAVQVTGTFGAATVTMQKSNDGVNYVALEDTAGDAISITSAGMAEFSTAAAYIRPQVSGGTGDDLDVLVIHWTGK